MHKVGENRPKIRVLVLPGSNPVGPTARQVRSYEGSAVINRYGLFKALRGALT
jgi:hypothetical protein